MRNFLSFILVTFLSTSYLFSQKISGVVLDYKTKESIIGANIVVKGTNNGASTDVQGAFSIELIANQQYPLTLSISFIGYQAQEVLVNKPGNIGTIAMKVDAEMLGEVNIIEKRLSDKQKESALTVEALDNLAIKETPAISFYDALGNLKGVDLTSASIGFKVINTRGFNSTSPVRSLQIIDGVDNQAPGLNFSLGNFLGASELDVFNVDIIAGASTAFYGPGAFNGVISMRTKSPFTFKGLSASVKVGERALTETAVRYAEAYKMFNKDYENLAFKINLYYLKANDWEATNYNPVDDSEVAASNPGGFDAVNIYGDEDLGAGGNNHSYLISVYDQRAGLGKFYRDGYREKDLVDYDTKNLKTNFTLAYKPAKDVELSYNFNFGTGTTVYQGENRFSLNDIKFYQNVVELKKKDKFFVRAYSTNENAGDSYDAVLTAFRMNNAIVDDATWNNTYKTTYKNLKYGDATLALTGLYSQTDFPNLTADEWFAGPYMDSLQKHNSAISGWHSFVRETVNDGIFQKPEPGTAAFDSLKNYVTSRTFTEGGSKFYDKSALYHVMGEYQFNPKWFTVRVGANYRFYQPNSKGNIFDELVYNSYLDSNNNPKVDTSFRKITNQEFGTYVGIEKKLKDNRLRLNGTIRLDKNENFDYVISPAVSVVYDVNEKNTIRASFGSAIRNPTLQDQYLHYNVGRAILKGNISGYDSLVTTESFDFYRNQEALNRDNLEYINIDPIQPEKVKTLEVGYRATVLKRVYLDANYYHSWYTDFIGYQLGLDVNFLNSTIDNFTSIQALRVAANAEGLVTTQGFNVGANVYISDKLTLNGNYSYNSINLNPGNGFLNEVMYGESIDEDAESDPIVPAYNTPEHKFNLGLKGSGYKIFKKKNHKSGFAINYKWVDAFLFEGSPQFTGNIEAYGLVDAQISHQIPKWHTTFKLGASNLLNNEVYQVYGGPNVGRMLYFSILFENFKM